MAGDVEASIREPVPPFVVNETICTSLARRGDCGAAATGAEEGATPKACAAARIATARLLAQLLVLALVCLQDALTVAGHRGILVAQALDLRLQLHHLAGLRLDAFQALPLGVDLAFVHRDPFLVDALAVHESVGRDGGLGPVVHRLLDSVVRIEDVHCARDGDHPAQAEHQHLLPLLGLVVLRDRAARVERVMLVIFGGIEILGFTLQEIHSSYLPVGTTT